MKKKNKFHVSWFWKGNSEYLQEYAFPTQEDAWAFVKGHIRKASKLYDYRFSRDGKLTEIDYKLVKKHLFENGKTERNDVVYCQNPSYWENWFYKEEK